MSTTNNNVIIGSGGGITNADFIDSTYPVGSRLNALYKKGFAYKTIGYRLPIILTKIIDQLSRDKNDISEKLGEGARDEIKLVVGHLAQLKNELQTNKNIRALPVVPSNCTNVSDREKINTIWNNYLTHIASAVCDGLDDIRWYTAPWLYVECYMYRRIYESFTSMPHFQTFDYFEKQKQDGYYESIEEVQNLADFVVSADLTSELTQQILLELSLWGNRCDLSLSSGESASQNSQKLMGQLESLKKTKILSDDSTFFWNKLKQIKDNDVSDFATTDIGYVLDNAGFELFTDLCFADSLLNYVARIDFYVKTMPWFISDTMTHDIDWLLCTMGNSDNPALQTLGNKWKDNLETKRWRIIAEPFWTYPHAFCEMKQNDETLYQKLDAHSLLIFKGDLNYRKLVCDINWERSTPFAESLYTFRASNVFAMRTIKADTVAGLKPGLGEEMDEKDPEWMTSGTYGLLQFASFKNN